MRIKDKLASGIGSVLEWYDFAIYGFYAPLIAQLYFPNEHQSISLLKMFSVFAVGFIARPFGAIIFGMISDKYGRTATLKITPILITIPSLIFGILPGYQQIGILAPCILIVLRILQGICIGGEYSNNIIYLCETAEPRHAYFLGSLGSCTGSFGIFLASTMAAISYLIFPSNILNSWGWRISFIMTLFFGIITFFMRKNMVESVVFQHIKNNNLLSNNPFKESIQKQYKDYLIAIGLCFLPSTAFYYIFVFMPTILTSLQHYSSSIIFGDNSITLFLRLLMIPLLGMIADKIGGIKIARISCLLFILLSYPLFYFILNNKNHIELYVFSFAILTTLNAATTPGLLMEFIKPQTRSTIISFAFNFSFGVFGGIVPVISLLLDNHFENNISSIYYLIFAALITFISTYYFRKAAIYD